MPRGLWRARVSWGRYRKAEAPAQNAEAPRTRLLRCAAHKPITYVAQSTRIMHQFGERIK